MPPPPAPFFCLVLCQELLLRSLERVFEQHCDCHRPNPTGDWGDGAGNAHGLVEVDVAHQPVPSLCRGVIDGVDSHIDDCRPGLEPRAFDVLGYPAGRYHNVSILQVKFRILRLGMDHSYCRVAFLSKKRACRKSLCSECSASQYGCCFGCVPLTCSRMAAGVPTMLLLPTTTAFLPSMGMLHRSKSSMLPFGVHGTKDGFLPLMASLPMFSGWKPSTSFSIEMALRTRSSSTWAGRGSWTRIP
mmetsp:Transcript_3350/g.8286  ORF Transcript_3350/g.8286 Transcript_3350/m.8286 type:complete len:244 (+) Transcript_3350:1800-2531(+)